MRWWPCVMLGVACGTAAPPPSAPANRGGSSAVVDAGVADACANPCMDTCCAADQVCSHGRAGDRTYAKCLRP